MDTIVKAARRIEKEFEEPVADVVAGYSAMSYSLPLVAEILDVSEPSLRMFCHRRKISFCRSPIEHRDIHGRPPRKIRHSGRTDSLSGWADVLGVSVSTVHRRVKRRGGPA